MLLFTKISHNIWGTDSCFWQLIGLPVAYCSTQWRSTVNISLNITKTYNGTSKPIASSRSLIAHRVLYSSVWYFQASGSPQIAPQTHTTWIILWSDCPWGNFHQAGEHWQSVKYKKILLFSEGTLKADAIADWREQEVKKRKTKQNWTMIRRTTGVIKGSWQPIQGCRRPK